MPNKSRWSFPIPEVTVPTFLFGGPEAPLPDKACFIDAENPDKHYLTYDDYRTWAKRFAIGLKKAGLQPGDTVQIYSGNSLFFPAFLMGTIMAGGKFTASNPAYNTREVAYQMQNADTKFFVLHNGFIQKGLDAANESGVKRENIFLCDDGQPVFDGNAQNEAGLKHWTNIAGSVEEARSFRWEEDKSRLDDTIILNYSSGTTGLPKGVELTHRNYVSNAMQHNHLTELRKTYERDLHKYRWLCFLPMYHAMAQTIFCCGGPAKRIPVYMMKTFDFEKMLANVEKFRITDLQLVPPVVVRMIKSPLVKKYDLSSVVSAGSGAAPLGKEVSNAFDRLWPPGQVNMKQGYGMTELTCSAIGWDPTKYSDSFGIGEPNANVEVKLVNPEDGETEVKQGERGEIWVRGPNVMKGYWKNEKATKETKTSDGWLKTGDIAYLDDNNTYFVVDRMKELIKVKGLQVAPAELEGVLLDHPDVSDACVVGVTINGDEAPRAYIVKNAGSKSSEKDIQGYMEEKVSKHKRLTGGVKFVDVIDKNPSGKILRKNYREQAKKEVGDGAVKESRL